MKIISEVKLTDEQVKNYRGKGYEVYYRKGTDPFPFFPWYGADWYDLRSWRA